ncbi:MAG: hypothetical protein ACJ8C4_16655 [Gemmataceae bacterium]
MRLLVLFVCLAIVGCEQGSSASKPATGSPAATGPAPHPELGINLTGIVDWSTELPFTDAFKTSRPWLESGPGPFTYDDRGNPLLRRGQVVDTMMLRGLNGHYPSGVYVATYEGSGQIDVRFGDVIDVVKQQPGRIEFRVRPADEGIMIRVLASSPRDPIRNVRVWLPGFEGQKGIFHPTFLDRLKPFSVVRFMDWQHTNGSTVFTWSQRAKLDDARWSTEVGAPIETMCELANAAHVHPWFCIPHGADDDFIRNLATLIKEKLDPSLKVYLEYSNEVWNWSFAQTTYASDRGKKLHLGAPDHLRFYAKRSIEAFDIFGEVFGSNDRLVRILSGQFANPSDSDAVLKYHDAYRHADALAVGAYFGYDIGLSKNLDAMLKLSPERIIDKLAQEIDGSYRDNLRRQKKIAQKYGLQLMTYEGGQHLVGVGEAQGNDQLTRLFIETNRHPRMTELYQKQLNYWVNEGGSTFTAFSFVGQPSKFGSWGILEFQDQPEEQAPKYRAFSAFAKTPAATNK